MKNKVYVTFDEGDVWASPVGQNYASIDDGILVVRNESGMIAGFKCWLNFHVENMPDAL